MTASQVFGMLKQTFYDWSEDKALRLSAALACYTIISLAPLIVITLKVVSVIPGVEAAVVERQMEQLVGQAGAQAIGQMIENADKGGGGTLATIISIIILLFSASGVFAELQDSMNTIWEVKPKPTLGWWETIKKRLLSMGMVFAIIFLLLVSMFVTAALGAVVNAVAGEGGGLITTALSYLVEFVATVLVVWALFMLIFKYLPDVKVQWSDVWPGALVTAVLFKLGQYALALYFYYGSATSAYGAAGSLVAVLLWAYYSAAILFFGAEFTQVYARQMGHRIEPDEDAVPLTDEDRAQRGIPSREHVAAAAAATETRAPQRGGPPPYRRPAAVPQRRVVTITRPTRDSQTAYAIAGVGLAAGLVVGALGMFKGRRYTRDGIEQVALDRRLDELESRLNGHSPECVATAIRVQERLDELEGRVRRAREGMHRRRTEAERRAEPTVKQRFRAAVEARQDEPNIIERLTGISTKPTFFERLSEMVSGGK